MAMRAVVAAFTLLALAAVLMSNSPRSMFSTPAASRVRSGAFVPYANHVAMQPVLMPIQLEPVPYATLALMPGDAGNENPLRPVPRDSEVEAATSVNSVWELLPAPRTVLMLAAIGVFSYLASGTTLGNWLQEPLLREVPAPHYDSFGIPTGPQTAVRPNGGVLLLLGSQAAGALLMPYFRKDEEVVEQEQEQDDLPAEQQAQEDLDA